MRNRIKWNLVSIIVILLISLGSCGITNEQKESVNKENLEELEENEMNELTVKISEILGCGNRTSRSIFEVLNKYVDEEITEITKETENIMVRLRIKDKKGNVYTAVIGRGYFVNEIYRGDERIYKIIE